MIQNLFLIFITVFFAMNMGASGIAPTFSAAYGAKLVNKRLAAFLFTVFVFLGAVTLGRGVVKTLSQDILPQQFINFDVALIVLLSATLSLFFANLLGIPESTSMVTVGSISGAGIYFGHIQAKTFFWLVPLWLSFPLVSFFLTYFIYRLIYPPRPKNLWLYEKILSKERAMRRLALVISCYGAFAVGTNNVANALGPLSGAKIIDVNLGLFLIVPFFGLGALVFGRRNIEAFGKEIVPLGMITANLVCLVTGSLLVVASSLGAPFPYVQLTALSIFAISCIKNGHRVTLGHHITRRTMMVWTLTPLLAVGVSYLLLSLFLKK